MGWINFVRRALIASLLLLLVTSNVSGISSNLDGISRKYKIYDEITLTTADGSLSQTIRNDMDRNIKFEKMGDEHTILVFDETKANFADYFWIYYYGYFYISKSDGVSKFLRSYNISLNIEEPSINFEFYVVDGSKCSQATETSSCKNYFLVHNAKQYFDEIARRLGSSDEMYLSYDENSFEMEANFKEPDDSMKYAPSGLGPADISEIWAMEYDSNGLLISFKYQSWVNFDGITLIDYTYEIRSGLFRKISAPGIGIVFFSFIVLLPLRNKMSQFKD